MKRALIVALLATVLVLLAWPDAHAGNLGSDVFQNVSGHRGSGLMDRYPLSAYALDTHIDSSTLPGASWGEEAAGFVTSILWTITAWLVKTTISLVVMAFSLDLLSAGGALTPIAKAIRDINDHVLGDPWMVAAISAAGFYAVWKGIVQRRHSEAASTLALSVVFVLIAMFLVFRPVQTVGQVASWTNDVSEGFLVGANTGSVANPGSAKQHIADELFRTQVINPWAVLEFGGLRHCVNGAKRDKDGYPTPVAPDDPKRTACRDHLKVVNGMGGYAPRFLRQPPGSDERDLEFKALRDGETPDGAAPSPADCPRGDCSLIDEPNPSTQFAGYHVDKSDSPAVDIQQEGSAYNRLVLALVILLTSLAFVVLFGMLALAIILAQIAALLILAFSPVVLLAAVIPGKGHQVFVAWGGKLLTALVIKAFYSLVVAVLIAVSAALTSATGTLGWLYAFGLLGAFYGMVFVKRKWLAEELVSKREYSKTERSVEKTAAAGAGMVAAPFVTLAGLAANKARQESGLGSQTADNTADTNRSEPAPTAGSGVDTRADKNRPTIPSGSVEHQEPQTAESALNGPRPGDTSSVPSPRGSGSVKEAAPTEPSAQSRPPTVPPSPEVAAAQQERAVESAPSESRGGVGKPGAVVPRDAVEPTSAQSRPPVSEEFPGLNTPDSVVSPQRRAERVPHVEGLPAIPEVEATAHLRESQERAPKGEDLAPPPEYRGP